MRNVTRHVSRCSGYEFEDVITRCDNVDLVAPSPPKNDKRNRIGRYIESLVAKDKVRIDHDVIVDKEYDLFFAFCLNPLDVRYLRTIRDLHQRCRRSICVIGELWPSAIEARRRTLQALQGFDQIFCGIESSVEPLRAVTGRPCRFLPLGVDAELFCPFPKAAARHIDVCNIGRRHEGLHHVLRAQADRPEFLYLFDTIGDFPVLDVQEHRHLLANLVKRSRYFIAYPPKFDRPQETGGLEEIGSRFFEGAAGGAVMLGMPSRCDSYDRCFDWPHAVIPVASDGSDVLKVIAELEADRAGTDDLRRNGIVQSLLRHDWVYRWQEILEAAGLPGTQLMLERQDRLRRLAAQICANPAFARSQANQADAPLS